VPYAAMVILWPFSPGIRLVFPVIPWIVFLALTGLHGLTEKFAPRHVSTAVCAFLLLISIPLVTAYRHTDFGLIRQSTGLPEFNQLCQAVHERTRSQDVLIYFRARARRSTRPAPRRLTATKAPIKSCGSTRATSTPHT
jgi:hypothetical protein